jgi:hypothetical protein
MIVVCKRGTKRLIKGHRYEVSKLWNSATTSRKRVFIDGIGTFAVTTFTTTDGGNLSQVDYTKPGYGSNVSTPLKFEDLNIGDVLVCKLERYKSFVKNGMYKVENLIVDKRFRILFKINQNGSLRLPVPGVKSIISHNLPSSVIVSLDGTSLVFTCNPNSYNKHNFTIKLDGHDDIKGTINFVGWGTSQVDDDSNRWVKFVGIGRKMKVNGWNFRKLNPDESREISLSHILDGEEVKIITSSDKRNIELVENKDDVLLKILAKSILDPHRHNLSIIDWGCSKHGDKLSLDSSDFEPYLNMSLSDILEKIK